MGAPEGGLKQCAKGRGQDRTSGGGACVSKARFPFVRVGRQAAGWRPFLLKSATVSGGHSSPCRQQRAREHAFAGWPGDYWADRTPNPLTYLHVLNSPR
jgi:hypothetical protein